MNIGFIILHYLNYEVTIECINSIMNLDTYNQVEVQIIVVDNASNNGSGEYLEKLYKNEANVNVLILNTTEGFSYGNNYGYRWLKDKYNFEFLIICNNDILFRQSNSIECIIDAYRRTGFYIMGPDVYVPKRKYHDNPHYHVERSEEWVRKRILDMKRKERYPLGRSTIIDIIRSSKLYPMYIKYLKRENSYNDEHIESGVCLSGACLILSKEFIACNEKIFEPETSFYWEEEILFHKCLINEWNIVYYPFLQVIHNEGIATRQKLSNIFVRRKRKLQLNIESAQIYLNYIEGKV